MRLRAPHQGHSPRGSKGPGAVRAPDSGDHHLPVYRQFLSKKRTAQALAAEALTHMQKLVSEAISQGRDTVDPAALATQITSYRSAALIGISQTAARSGPLMKKHHALARRLTDRQDDYLRFTQDWQVPPDNNGCERDIRMTKLRQKVSGCLRTLAGARQFCAIRSYLSTAAKHGLSSFDILVMLTEGQPWIPVAA
jgi:transposase